MPTQLGAWGREPGCHSWRPDRVLRDEGLRKAILLGRTVDLCYLSPILGACLDGPLAMENTAPTAAIMADTMNARLMPWTNALDSTRISAGFVPAKSELTTWDEATVAMTAPVTARLSDCPVVLIVATMPEATPN